jgi:hypothetical protein
MVKYPRRGLEDFRRAVEWPASPAPAFLEGFSVALVVQSYLEPTKGLQIGNGNTRTLVLRGTIFRHLCKP